MSYNNTFGKENAFSEEYKQLLRLHGAYAISVVGTVYASGQPDIDCTSVHGQNTKIELKVYRGLSVPTRDNILKLLKGPQVNVICHQLIKRGANCLIIAQIGAKPDTCCIVSQHNFSIALVADTAKVIAHLKWGERPPY